LKKRIPIENAEKLSLQLFVSGMSRKSMVAIENIKSICEKYFTNCFDLEIIDIYKNPEAAGKNQVVFSPSLIKKLPLPKKILVGNFSDIEKVKRSLGVKM
jgi:circadian clock protein KaiB